METFIVLCECRREWTKEMCRENTKIYGRWKAMQRNGWNCVGGIFSFYFHEFHSHYRENYIFTRSCSTHIHSIYVCILFGNDFAFFSFKMINISTNTCFHSFSRRWLLLVVGVVSMYAHTNIKLSFHKHAHFSCYKNAHHTTLYFLKDFFFCFLLHRH